MIAVACYIPFTFKVRACLEASMWNWTNPWFGFALSKCGFKAETGTGSAETVPGGVCSRYTWREIRGP